MPASNRQIKTGHVASAELMTLEVLQDGTRYKAGQLIKVSKSEAKRLCSVAPKMFRVKMD